ncbi:MAG: AAA family ATPase [Planctomycetia bacterium 21-64-5]|nr:MAG: AAA family ATPase [Planctomycetia bacterium 21-64-5]HQU41458.1 UvrD-helicase domain-containing protein [Pirellulales bacterium]
MNGLNAAQQDAVATLSGPLLVLAGAGTGKTRVVTFRIAALIKHRVSPDRILAVTFTNKAAGEMQGRAASLLGKRRKGDKRPEISTFHSLCVRILKRHITRLGYPAQFAIYDRGDQESVARAALRDIRVDGAVLRPSDLINIISRWKTAAIRPNEAAAVAASDKEHLAAMAYRRYQRSLKTAGAVDFDDLLLCTEELFATQPDVLAAEAGRFDHLLIDEYQDTNGAQYRIVKALAAPHRNLCVVGDDDQSIYGWRGAEVAHILRFKRDWPDAKVVRLEENYRSIGAILQMANTLIAFNRQRHDKVLRAFREEGERPRMLQYPDEMAEANQVIEEINSQIFRRIAQPRDFAILFRTNEQPRAFEQELRRAKLPYTLIGGMSFYDRKEVRDILAYLRVLVHPRDEVSLLRIINTPARGIGQRAVETLLARAVSQGRPLWEILPEANRIEGLPDAAVKAVGEFRRSVETFQQRLERESPVEVAASLVHTVGYQDEINRQYKEPAEQLARWNTVEEVINSLAGYQQRAEEPTLAGFLDDVALVGRDDQQDKESQLAKNAVVLMTLHSAKGLEFPQVYLVGMEEGLLPHHRSVDAAGAAIDEERRLCYVGVTRAKDRLTLTMALNRNKWGKSRPTMPSRFLFELLGKAEHAHSAKPPHAKKEKPRTKPTRTRR